MSWTRVAAAENELLQQHARHRQSRTNENKPFHNTSSSEHCRVLLKHRISLAFVVLFAHVKFFSMWL